MPAKKLISVIAASAIVVSGASAATAASATAQAPNETTASAPANANVQGDVTKTAADDAARQLQPGQERQIGSINNLPVSVKKDDSGRAQLEVANDKSSGGATTTYGVGADVCYWGIMGALTGLGAAGLAALIAAAPEGAAAIAIGGVEVDMAWAKAMQAALSINAGVDGVVAQFCHR